MISSSSSLASSMPATSLNVTLFVVLAEQLRAALAEGHRLAAAALHLAHEEDPEADQEQHREPVDEEHVPERLGILAARVDPDALFAEVADELGILRGEGLETLAVGLLALDVLPWTVTSVTSPLSTAERKSLKIISWSREGCFVKTFTSSRTMRMSRSQSARFRES